MWKNKVLGVDTLKSIYKKKKYMMKNTTRLNTRWCFQMFICQCQYYHHVFKLQKCSKGVFKIIPFLNIAEELISWENIVQYFYLKDR